MEKTEKDKDKERKEKEEKHKSEIEIIFKNFESKRMGIKKEPYLDILEAILEKWNLKLKEPEIAEYLSLCSIKILETGLKEKDLANFHESLTQDGKTNLAKLFFCVYERVSNKKDVGTLKSTKLFNIHNKLIESEGAGGVARSMFSIQK